MNRLEWILGIMLVILLIVVVVLSLLFWFRPDNATISGEPNSATTIAQQAKIVEATPRFEGRTAKIAFVEARTKATAWECRCTIAISHRDVATRSHTRHIVGR